MMCSIPPERELALSGYARDSRISNRRQRKRKKSASPFHGTQYGEQASPASPPEGPRAGHPPSGEHGTGRCLRRADLSPTPLSAARAGPKVSKARPDQNHRKPRQPAALRGVVGSLCRAPLRRGRLPCPPQDSPFAAAILFPASAATAPRTGPRPGPSHPLVQAPHPQLQQPLGALPVAILSVPLSSAPAPPPPPSRHFVAAPSLPLPLALHGLPGQRSPS